MAIAKILIVEDENIVALDLMRRLNKLGYDVVGMAADASRALTLVEAHKPDVVLMDIHIQGNTDGIEVARIIFDKYLIPVIFLTAYSEDSTLLRAKESKPYGYLIKPYSERELHAVIQVALEKNSSDREILDTKMHLQLALDAGKLATWEASAETADVIVSFASDGYRNTLADWSELSKKIIPEDKSKVAEKIASIQHAEGLSIELAFEIEDEKTGHRWLAMFGKSFATEFGIKIVGVMQDVTDRRMVEESLKQAALVYSCSADGIVILDSQKRVLSCNSAFTRITGCEENVTIGEPLQLLSADVIGENAYEDFDASLRENGFWQGEIKTFRVNHEYLYAWMNISAIPDAISPFGQYVAVISDITEIRATQEKLSRIAYYDALTGLPNRNLFMDRLEMAVANSMRERSELALLFLDLDHFKRVNDTLGHQAGDVLLKAVAGRLRSEIRAVDTLCRVGGDEFIIIIDRFNSEQDLSFVAQKLLDALSTPVRILNTEVIPHASIGISLYPKNAKNKDDLIKMADTAMYSAKSEGRCRYAFYRKEFTDTAEHYVMRENELRQALKEQELLMHYQPQYDTNTNEVVGLEALIRWQHPRMGLVAANEVIPIAETSDLIISIGNWVINEVCRQCREWLDKGLQVKRLGVNASPRQLQEVNFVSEVSEALRVHNVSPQLIDIEVTESCLQDNETTIRNLIALEKLGVTISIDDFGTGYSCFSSLKSLPIHRLKIDRTFVRDTPKNENDCAIVSAIVAMAAQMNLATIAEGIETEEQLNFMRAVNCKEVQGFLFSRPVPAVEVECLLRGVQPRSKSI